ncbi:MAG: trypsin-like peptidase domain-containing protein [Candidatus Kapaibacterium sp.]
MLSTLQKTTMRLFQIAIITAMIMGGLSSCSAQNRDSSPELQTISASEADSLKGNLDRANESIDRSRRTAITDAVARVAPAIVGINVTEVREVRGVDPWSAFESDPFFQEFMDMFPRRGSRTYRQELHGLGSGFIVSPDGYIITNDHVAGQATKVVVTTTDGKEHEATVIGTDRASDVALLKIDGENFPYLSIGNSDDVLVGEWAIALGNPFGLFDINAKPTVTVGVVSNTNVNLRPQEDRVYVGMIQTDAAISSGNSGGPLVNALGEVIGMNTVIYSTAQSYRGAGSIGIGFSVPIKRVMEIVDELKTNGKIDRDFWIGMNVGSIDNSIAKYLKLESTEGAVIVEVAPRSPATIAELEVGDVITEVNGAKVRTHEDFYFVVYDARVGDTLSLKVLRKGEVLEKKLTLTKRR